MERGCLSSSVSRGAGPSASNTPGNHVSSCNLYSSLPSASDTAALEIVSVGRYLLRDDNGDTLTAEDFTCKAYVMGKRTDPITKVKFFRLRYFDGTEEDVCIGAVHRVGIGRHHQASTLQSHEPPDDNNTETNRSVFVNTVDDYKMPYDGHPSSAADFFSLTEDSPSARASSTTTETASEYDGSSRQFHLDLQDATALQV